MKGFTFIETIVVIFILGLAAAITIPAIEKSQETVGIVREAVDLKNIQGALEQYHNSRGYYPQGSNAELVIGLRPYILFEEKYIRDGLFIDSWGNPYVYRCPGFLHPESYDLFSWGPTGVPPGELIYGRGGEGFKTVICGVPQSVGIQGTGSVSPVGDGEVNIPLPPKTSTSGSGGGSGGSSASSGGGPGTTVQIDIPWDLTVVPNDSMVYLSWKTPTYSATGNAPDFFRVYRSWIPGDDYELIATVPYVLYPDRQGFFPDADVSNNYTYYYRVTAVWEGDNATESEFSQTVKVTPSANSIYAEQIADSLEILGETQAGNALASLIDSQEVTLGFGQISSLAIAWFEPLNEAIIINLGYFSKDSKVGAALLAHEATHAQWFYDPAQGTPVPDGGDRSSNSIDQEYHAFLNAALVWEELDAAGLDFNLDVWSAVTLQGEEEAKSLIRAVYWGLPEY